jgi:hypothetical protein
VSVAELCRRLGPVPATADSVATGATPLLIGDLLRREGRPEVGPDPFAPVVAVPEARRAPSPRPAQDDDPAALPVPRRRGEACKTALGAGGLVVAGSVLGAALLAAAGVGGALPVPQGDDGTGQFQGEGTLRTPGTAYGSVSGRQVVSGASLVRAVGYYLPFARTTAAPTAAPRSVARPAVLPASVAAARGAVPAQAFAPVAVPASGNPGAGLPQVVGQVTQPVAPVTQVVAPVTGAVGSALGGVTGPLGPTVNQVADTVVGPLAQQLNPVVTPVAAAVAPAVAGVTDLVKPVAGAVGPVIGPVAAPLVRATTPILDPVLRATAPIVDAVAPASTPILTAVAPVTSQVMAAAQPAVGQVLAAAGPGLAAVGPLVEPLQDLAEPVATQVGATGLPQGDVSALQTQAIPAVRSMTVGATSALQSATAPAGSVVEEVTEAVGVDAVTPSGLRAADLPTMRLPIVGEARTPLVADDSPTTPLRIVPSTDEPGPSVDSPTLPLRIVQPARPDTDGGQTDDVRSDGAQERTEGQDSGRDSSGSTESDGGGLTDAVSSVTGLLNP